MGIVSFLGAPSYGQDFPENTTEQFTKAFIGFCVQNAGNNDKVEAAANVLGFEELEGDMKAMVAPQDPNVEYKGWFVKDNGQISFLLGISETEMKGVRYSTCAIANPRIPIEEVIVELQAFISFGTLLDAKNISGQRYRAWETPSIAERSFISVIDAPDMGIEGGTLSLSAPSLQKE